MGKYFRNMLFLKWFIKNAIAKIVYHFKCNKMSNDKKGLLRMQNKIK